MIQVDVYIPSVDKTYDFILDESKDLKSIIADMVLIISKKTGSAITPDPDRFMLFRMDTETQIPSNGTLFNYEVRDGQRLMLV